MVSFSRFGLDETLTVEDLRAMVERKEIKPTDLLQADDSNEWKRARDIPALRTIFGQRAEAPLQLPMLKSKESTPEPLPAAVRAALRLIAFFVAIGSTALFFRTTDLGPRVVTGVIAVFGFAAYYFPGIIGAGD